jgi:hypothetical protein
MDSTGRGTWKGPHDYHDPPSRTPVTAFPIVLKRAAAAKFVLTSLYLSVIEQVPGREYGYLPPGTFDWACPGRGRISIQEDRIMEKKVIEAMKKAGKPMKSGEIAEAIGADNKEVTKIINELKKKGKVASPKRCFYEPA